MRSSLLLGVFPLLAVVGCSIDDSARSSSDTLAREAQPIVAGAADSTNASTVYLSNASGASCSGALIYVDKTTGYVLTAATCKSMTQITYVPAGASDKGATAAKVFTVSGDNVDSTFNGNPTKGHAYRVLQFQGADASLVATPAVWTADGLSPGSMIELSGFGATTAGVQPTGTRAHVSVPISALDANVLQYDPASGHAACAGDAGGPVYATVNGQKVVVGVISAGDSTCAGSGLIGRVQASYDPVILSFISFGTCDQCTMNAADSCYGPTQFCLGDNAQGGCTELNACMGSCSPIDTACAAQCASKATSTATMEFNAMSGCFCSLCTNQCPMQTCKKAPTGTWSGPTTTASTTASSTSAAAGGASTTTGAGGAGASSGSSGCSVASAGSSTDSNHAAALAIGLAIAIARRRRHRSRVSS